MLASGKLVSGLHLDRAALDKSGGEMPMPPGNAPCGSAGAQLPDLARLRLAFVSGNYNCVRDGANRAQNELVRFLLRQGAQVRVYSPTIDTPAFEPAGDLVSIPSLPMGFGRKEYRVSPRLPRSVRQDIATFAPNLFHISVPLFHGKSALSLAHKMGVPVVGAMHTRFETYPRYYGLSLFEGVILASLRRFYRGCSRVMAPCESAARTMEEQGLGENIGIWTRGVDPLVFTPSGRDMDWRRAQGIGDEEVVLGFLGRLVLEKGLGDFVSVVKCLRREGVRFRVLVIGDGPARDWFEGEMGDAVFTGLQQGEELCRSLASCDVLLNPSSTEAFGNVSLEAMACGVPVVAARATGNMSLVVDGETGALVEPGDVAGYSAALRRYIAQPTRRELHGRAAHRRSAEFTWDAANAAIGRVYLELLETPAG